MANKSSTRQKVSIILYAIIVVALFVLIYFVPSVFETFTPTLIAEIDTVKITDEVEGYIVRDENVYFAARGGLVTPNIPEGERARKGEKIVSIASYTVDDNEELTALNEKINKFALGDNIFANDIGKLDDIINKTEDQLKEAQKKKNAELVQELEDKLARLHSKRAVINASVNTVAENLNIEEGTTKGATIIGSDVSSVANPKSAEGPLEMTGTISYCMDGYESEFTPDNMYMLNKDKVSEQDIKVVNTYQMGVKQGNPVFKLVKSATWYLVSWVPAESVIKYIKGNIVRIQSEALGDREVTGKIDDIVDINGNVLVIMKFDTYFPEVSQVRKIPVTVVTLDSEGLRVSNKSIAMGKDEEGVDRPGVYVKGLNGKFEFRPIKILKSDGEYTLIQSVSFDETQGEGDNKKVITVDTVSPFDEILRNGEDGGK